MTMIIIKKAKIPPKDEKSSSQIQYVFLEGAKAQKEQLGIRVDQMRGGDYMILYKVDFKDYHKVRKLNLRFSSVEDIVSEATVTRINPISYKESFFNEMCRRLEKRILL